MNTNDSLKKIFHIYLFLPVLPLLNLFVKNYYILSQNELIYLTLLTIGIFIFGLALKIYEQKRNSQLSKYYLIWVFLFFNYFSITNFAFSNFPPFLTSINNYAFYFYMINFIVLTFVFIKFYQKNVFQVLLNVFVVLSIFTSSYYFFSEFLKSRSNSEYITSESVIEGAIVIESKFIF